MAAIPHVAVVSFLEDAEAYMGTSPSVDFVTGISAILATTAKQSPARPCLCLQRTVCDAGSRVSAGQWLPVETAAPEMEQSRVW